MQLRASFLFNKLHHLARCMTLYYKSSARSVIDAELVMRELMATDIKTIVGSFNRDIRLEGLIAGGFLWRSMIDFWLFEVHAFQAVVVRSYFLCECLVY